MSIYCLTLKTQSERQEALRLRFPDSDVRFFYGVDGVVSGLERPADANYPQVAEECVNVPKHIGMTISHYMLWSSLLTHGHSTALILEDDAIPVDGWHERYHQIQAALPDEPTMAYLGNCCVGNKDTELLPGLWRVDRVGCTHGYLVNKNALRELVSGMRLVDAPVDAAISLLMSDCVTFYAAVPPLFTQVDTILPP